MNKNQFVQDFDVQKTSLGYEFKPISPLGKALCRKIYGVVRKTIFQDVNKAQKIHGINSPFPVTYLYI